MNDKTIRLIVSGLLAYAFLGLYAFVLVKAIGYAHIKDPPADAALSDEAWWLLQSIGALVSAVVAAELAVTNRGEAPAGRALGFTGAGEEPTTGARIATLAYLAVWLGLGLLAVVFGMVECKTRVPALIDFAKAWVGLALGAAYAYLGVHRG